MSAKESNQPKCLKSPRGTGIARGWRGRALSGLTLTCVSLLGSVEFTYAQQPSVPPAYRPASHAGVP
ncbi:MAG: hypothetical protein ACKO9H_01855, partial [Planctomycetota bacterium]